ncbi:MAG: NosD domain-containing protein [Thermoplasmata archaeon]
MNKNRTYTISLLLFLGVVILTAVFITAGKANAATIYVDDSGGEQYMTIQAAVNASSPDDTVFVYNGTYHEMVVIAKKINLVGESNQGTIIKATSSMSYIDNEPKGVHITRSYVKVANIKIDGFSHGIYVEDASYTNITSNTIINSHWEGICFYHSSYNTIMYNTITNSSEHNGIELYSDGNTITSNTITNNKYGVYFGGINNTIMFNTITNNYVGVYLSSSSSNTGNVIMFNNISGNQNYGLQLSSSYYDEGNTAINNWWGSSTGPYNTDENLNGGGDKVSSGVIFSPWATTLVNVNLRRVPTINITSVKNNDLVTGVVNISGTAMINGYLKGEAPTDGVANVTLKITRSVETWSSSTPETIKTISSDAISGDKIVLELEDAQGRVVWKYAWNTTPLTKGDYIVYVWTNTINEAQSLDYQAVVTVNHAPNITIESLPPCVSGAYTINGTAIDSDSDDSVQIVQVKIDNGEWLNATDTSQYFDEDWSRWSYEINTSTLTDGDHSVCVRAFDTDWQHTTPKSTSTECNAILSVNNTLPLQTNQAVNQAPSITITTQFPSKVKGTIAISGTAADDVSIDRVQIKVDNLGWVDATGKTSWNHSLDTATLSDGNHTVTVRAYDGALYSQEKSVTITVENKPAASEPTKETSKGFAPGLESAALLAALGLCALIVNGGRKRRQ